MRRSKYIIIKISDFFYNIWSVNFESAITDLGIDLDTLILIYYDRFNILYVSLVSFI